MQLTAPLTAASCKGHCDCAELLISRKANVNILTEVTREGKEEAAMVVRADPSVAGV